MQLVYWLLELRILHKRLAKLKFIGQEERLEHYKINVPDLIIHDT